MIKEMLPGYDVILQKRGDGRGGVAIAVRRAEGYTIEPIDAGPTAPVEYCAVRLSDGVHTHTIASIYAPPASNMPLAAALNALAAAGVTCIAGDLNCRHPDWCGPLRDTYHRGDILHSWLQQSGWTIRNTPHEPTTMWDTVVDLVMVAPTILAPQCTVLRTHLGVQASDHYPVILEVLPRHVQGARLRHRRINFSSATNAQRDAARKRFMLEVASWTLARGNRVDDLYRRLKNALLCAQTELPRSSLHVGRNTLPDSLAMAAVDPDAYEEQLHVSGDAVRSPESLWGFARHVSSAPPPNRPITGPSGPVSENRARCDLLKAAFYEKTAGQAHRMIPQSGARTKGAPMSDAELRHAPRTARSSTAAAMDPDGIHPHMLARLANETRPIIKHLFNTVIRVGKVPRAWKLSTLIPIVKPGKNATEVQSYRPIAMTSIIGRLFERVILRRFAPVLAKLNDAQFAYRPYRTGESRGRARGGTHHPTCAHRRQTHSGKWA